VAVHEERLAGGDVDRHDVAGQLGRERDHAGAGDRLVVGEEQAAAAQDALEAAHEAAAALSAGAHVLSELDVRGHPGELAVGGDHLLALLQGDLEDRHRGALDLGLHDRSCRADAVTRTSLPGRSGLIWAGRRRGGCPISASTRGRGLALWTT